MTKIAAFFCCVFLLMLGQPASAEGVAPENTAKGKLQRSVAMNAAVVALAARDGTLEARSLRVDGNRAVVTVVKGKESCQVEMQYLYRGQDDWFWVPFGAHCSPYK